MANIKKILTFGSIAAVAATGIVAAFAYKFTQPDGGFKPVFFNYAAYLAPSLQTELEQKFSYRTYLDLPTFKQQLIDGKIIGGISSGYQIAQLAAQGLIQPINFNYFFGTENVDYNETWAQNNYSPIAFQQMEQYNPWLAQQFKNQGMSSSEIKSKAQMWKYMVPYFTQDKVIAFNIDRLNNLTQTEKNAWLNDTPEQLNARFTNKSYVGILQTLKNAGAEHFGINDIFRQNLAIGSAYDNSNPTQTSPNVSISAIPKPSPSVPKPPFAIDNDLSNFENQVDGFVNTIQAGTGFNIKNTNHISLLGSDADILSNLVNPNQQTSVGIIYNGDALQAFFPFQNFPAFYSQSNLSIEQKNPIRIIRANNQISLLDGFVLASTVTSQSLQKEILHTFFNTAYNGSFGLGKNFNGFFPNGSQNSVIDEITQAAKPLEEYEKFEKTNAFTNFNFIAYTPSTNFERQLVLNNYFSQLIKQNQNILGYNKEQETRIINWAKYIMDVKVIEKGTTNFPPILILPTPDIITSEALIYYNSQTKS